MPRNWLEIGRKLKLTVTGAISNIVTTPGLMNFQVKIGSVAAFDTGNIQLNASVHTTLPFWLKSCSRVKHRTDSGSEADGPGERLRAHVHQHCRPGR
jgi:hypothetical protein